ncbi:MAG: SDR family oxidoreductase [Pseudomonadota bacterium]
MTTKQRVLILGGSDGIGEAIARSLTQEGAEVFVTSRDLEKAKAAALNIGGTTMGLSVDVANGASIEAAVAAATEGGDLTGLAYCVGSIDLKPLARASADDFAKSYALNVIGAAMTVKATAASLKSSGHGSVVLFSTVAARQGFTNHSIIASAKGGIEGLTVSLAAEMAPDVRVNAIAPSLTRTPIAAPLLASETVTKSLAQAHPLPRLGTPEDHAALACLLLSPSSSWMTGQVIGVDGGRSTLRTGRS